MISCRTNKYCNEDISLIENYDKAINDDTQTWHCHHRLETDLNYTTKQLIDKKLYYDRPASELIFLLPSEHVSLHMQGDRNPMYHKNYIDYMTDTAKEAQSKKRSVAMSKYWSEHIHPCTGKPAPHNAHPHSEETKKKQSETMKKRFAAGEITVWNKGKKGVQTAWNKGKKGVQISCNKGKRYMNNGVSGLWVDKADFDKYIKLGYKFGYISK